MFKLAQIVVSTTCILLSILPTAYSATILNVWQAPNEIKNLNQFYFNNENPALIGQKNTYVFVGKNINANSDNQFKLHKITVTQDNIHLRYNQLYRNVPIWSSELIVHHNNKTKLTGSMVTDIEKDILSVEPKLNLTAALSIAKQNLMQQFKGHLFSAIRLLSAGKVIYIEGLDAASGQGTAKLSFLLTFFIDDLTNKTVLNPVYLVDAQNGKVLKYYDNRKRLAASGTGPGGNDLTRALNRFLPRASNHYQFGNAIVGLPSLGFLPVMINTVNNTCTMATNITRLSSWNNVVFTEDSFPVTYAQEGMHPVFTYPCTPASKFQNTNDGGFAPIVNNGFTAYSPSNDTFYFANLSFQMLQAYLPDVPQPWGVVLPIRIYTHVGEYDNAGAFSPPAPGSEPYNIVRAASFPPQFIVGNGKVVNYPLSDSGTVGHELAHIFTAYASNLIYDNQSGGINEAYSDITGATLDAYINKFFPFYGFNWAIGPSVSLPSGPDAGKASRYMYNPPLDGVSIANAANFRPGMDVHHSSGVYNKAFYLLVTQYGVNIVSAFRYFSYANLHYWTRGSDFDFGSCGVMQAAIDLHNKSDFNKIVSAFKAVGVTCKIGLQSFEPL